MQAMMIAILMLAMTGCGGTVDAVLRDRTDPVPAEIVNVNFVNGKPGDKLTFKPTLVLASGEASSSVQLSWDFGLMATPRYSTDLEPEVELTGSPGEYDISIIVRTGISPIFHVSEPRLFQFNILHAIPEIASIQLLSLNYTEAEAGSTHTFEAIIFPSPAEGTVLSYSWDFGDSASPKFSTAAMPDVQISDIPGEQSISLQIHMKDGLGRERILSGEYPFEILQALAEQE